MWTFANQHDAHYTKPVGIHWLQVAAVRTAEAFGVPNARTAIWLYRLPSVFGSIGAVLVTYWCALAFVRRRGAMLAGLMNGRLASHPAPKRGSPEPMP